MIRASIYRNGLILMAFALVTSGLISLVYVGTKQPIAVQQQQKVLSTLNAVIDPSTYDNQIAQDCALVTSRDLLGSDEPQRVYLARREQRPVAAGIETTAPNGYSGKIKLLVGVKEQGTISGVRVLAHKETPGLGDKIDIRVSDWIRDFNGKQYLPSQEQRWAVRKDGGQFDQFTGATITPRAVVQAVKNAVIYYQQNQTALFTAENQCSKTPNMSRTKQTASDTYNE